METLLIIFFISALTFAKVITHIDVQENSAFADRLKGNIVVPNDSALLVFISDSTLTIKSNMDKLNPVHDGNLYKVLIPVVPDGKRIITLKYKNTEIDLYFGIARYSNSLPILTEKEIRAFDVELYSRVKIFDVTKEWKNKNFTITPIEQQGNALLIFTSQTETDSFDFSSDVQIISSKSKFPGKYEVAIKSVPQKISVYSQGFDTGFIVIDSIAEYEWKRYELQLPRDPYFKPISLNLLSKPSGANVLIGEKSYGKTPLRGVLGFINGKYPFTFTKKNYDTFDTLVQIDDTWRDRQTILVKLKLSPTAPPEPPLIRKKNYRLVASFAILAAVCGVSGIVSNEYAGEKYNEYKQLNVENGSNQYEESWNRVAQYRNLRDGFYIGAVCFWVFGIITYAF